jgi:hypothetical protein
MLNTAFHNLAIIKNRNAFAVKKGRTAKALHNLLTLLS